MKFGSIRFRLTVWYVAILAFGLGAFGVGSWFAMRASAFRTIDEELSDRIGGVDKFMQLQISALSPAEIRDEFREHSVLGPGGDLFQVCNQRGDWLYRSAVLENNQIRIPLPSQLSSRPVYENVVVQNTPLRFATASITVDGQPYAVQVAMPLGEFYGALNRFRLILWFSAPLLLLGAGVGGYFISRRALRPVDSITQKAESISIENLSDRLEVPDSSDELQRLSATLNRMLARLDASVTRMSQFTADASHELRSPISLIRTTAELALHSGRSDAEYRQDMAHILSEAKRTGRMIDSLLLLARADTGEGGLQHEVTDISSSLREALEQGRSLASEKQISLTAGWNGAPAAVRGDGEALRRLFFILIDNAIKYTPCFGWVRVGLEISGSHAKVQVMDSGVGIADTDQAHIFDRFWRADKVRSRGSGGAGLGLAIARWIVNQHHGTIEVHSQPGKGSTFTVRIPLTDTPV